MELARQKKGTIGGKTQTDRPRGVIVRNLKKKKAKTAYNPKIRR